MPAMSTQDLTDAEFAELDELLAATPEPLQPPGPAATSRLKPTVTIPWTPRWIRRGVHSVCPPPRI